MCCCTFAKHQVDSIDSDNKKIVVQAVMEEGCLLLEVFREKVKMPKGIMAPLMKCVEVVILRPVLELVIVQNPLIIKLVIAKFSSG